MRRDTIGDMATHGLNKVFLIGNVGRDAELRYTSGGQAIAQFPLATTETYTGRDGAPQERTTWHTIIVWGKSGEFCGQYVKKGRKVFIEGRLCTRDWIDVQAVKHYKTEVIAQDVQLLDRPKEVAPAAPEPEPYDIILGDEPQGDDSP